MQSEQLESLRQRVAEATGPDRQIDAALVTTLCPGATVGEYIHGEGYDVVFHAYELGIYNKARCPEYTASLDAALALVERLLPDAFIDMHSRAGGRNWEVVITTAPSCMEGKADTAPFAILAALLASLLSEAPP